MLSHPTDDFNTVALACPRSNLGNHQLINIFRAVDNRLNLITGALRPDRNLTEVFQLLRKVRIRQNSVNIKTFHHIQIGLDTNIGLVDEITIIETALT